MGTSTKPKLSQGLRTLLLAVGLFVVWFLLLTFCLFVVGCTKTVTVERTVYKPVPVTTSCTLPELGELPTVQMEAGPDGTRCLDLNNRKKLAERLSRMRQWIEQAKVRCGPPSSQPTDAGGG